MYQFNATELASPKAIKFHCLKGEVPLTVQEFIQDLRSSLDFQLAFSSAIANCPFPAVFFELPPITQDRLQRPFEFVLVESNSLVNIKANPSAFAEHLTQDTKVVAFHNLGGDARLIVPCPAGMAKYGHLKAFLGTASLVQVRAFWEKVAEEYEAAIGDAPKWLSTAGLGVSWLHLRIDSRPKYYRYQPYKQL